MQLPRIKFPKIDHLPWSNVSDGEDSTLASTKCFDHADVVVSEKIDGECSSLYRDYLHARSLDSGAHLSRTWLKNLHAQVAHKIPEGWRVCGENVFAKHSIFYKGLPSYFFVFAVYDDSNKCLRWSDTVDFAHQLGLEHVPVLFDGCFDEDEVKKCYTGKSVFGDSEQEGYVVRWSSSICWEAHRGSFAKYVRPGHV